MSGTVTARDIWLLADVPLFLSLQDPLWCGLPVKKDVQMCSNRDVLFSVNLCLTFMHSVNMMRCQAEAEAGKQTGAYRTSVHKVVHFKEIKSFVYSHVATESRSSRGLS